MPTTPVVTGIVDALDTLLDAISAGATYNTTPTVAQYRTAPFVVTDTPALNLRVLGRPQPRDLLMGKWDHPLRIAIDIAAKTPAEYHNTLVDVLVAMDSDKTLGGLIYDINFLGDEIVYEQEDKSFLGGTALFELVHRTDDLRI